MTTLELVQYYQNLLILQYIGKQKAYATIGAQVTPVIMPQTSVQTITFASAPSSGNFVIGYNGNNTVPINWNDVESTIQTDLQNLAGLETVTVSGSIASLTLAVTMTGVTPPANLLTVVSSTLDSGTPTVTEIDETLPLAVQDGFNLIGTNIAQGIQLDVIGKYVGVTRFGAGFNQNITLNDSDFLSLIHMAIISNSNGSSLATIQAFIQQFFSGEMLVFDYKNMRMSYMISESVGSQNLIQMFIVQDLLPRPMGVGVFYVIYAPTINNFFGFRTYELPGFNSTPFNSYTNYNANTRWLSYADAIVV